MKKIYRSDRVTKCTLMTILFSMIIIAGSILLSLRFYNKVNDIIYAAIIPAFGFIILLMFILLVGQQERIIVDYDNHELEYASNAEPKHAWSIFALDHVKEIEIRNRVRDINPDEHFVIGKWIVFTEGNIKRYFSVLLLSKRTLNRLLYDLKQAYPNINIIKN